MNTKAQKIIKRHNAKRGNRPNPVILTNKAIDEIVLALKCARRNTEIERDYLKRLAKKLLLAKRENKGA